MSQDSPDSPAWDQLHAQIEALRDEWRAVTHGLTADEAPSTADCDSIDDEEHWTVAQIHSHVASSLLRYAAALLQVAISEGAVFDRPHRLVPGDPPYSRICEIEELGWTALDNAIKVVALQPDPGAAIGLDDGFLTTRQLVERAINHVQEHIEQVSALRPDAP